MQHKLIRGGWLMVALGLTTAAAQDSGALAKRYFDDAVRITDQVKDGISGEMWCWRAAFNIHHFEKGYHAFSDTTWLDYGVKYYDALLEKMATAPDGYRGWIGPYGYDTAFMADVHIGDAILFNGMLSFAVLVHETPALQPKYGEKAADYVRLARKHLIEKWDARGTWYEDGPFGGYRSWDRYLTPGNRDEWQTLPDVRNSGISLPFNKQNSMAIAMLRIWRITGEEALRGKAVKIFSFLRSRFQFFDDHVTWCYWEPLGPFDIEPSGERTRHWMNVHPFRNYQAGEVGEIVEAYHYGVVFTETDLRRILNTNLNVMYNGDPENPRFRNSNIRLPGYVESPASKDYPTRAGCLWSSLADFDERIRQLTKRTMTAGDSPRAVVDRLYLEKVTLAGPVSFERRIVKNPQPGDLPSFPDRESSALVVRSVLPAVIGPNQEAFLLSKVPVSGDLAIDLMDARGEQKVTALDRASIEGGMDGHAGVHLVRWNRTDSDGKAIPPGAYRVRWTFRDQVREFAVQLQ